MPQVLTRKVEHAKSITVRRRRRMIRDLLVELLQVLVLRALAQACQLGAGAVLSSATATATALG